jgi:DNA processing protein
MRQIRRDDAEYPERLKAIHDPPAVLFVRGTLPGREEPAVAIVGARRATPYGLSVARRLGGELARAGFTVVSGLARGIDGAAHEGAIRAGGRTIGVMGCGLDIAYPPEHIELIEEMVRQGAVVSEFPVGTPPYRANFPKRNRIISGMSLGVVVVEAGPESGALITARLALEQGREVFAVPGPAGSAMSVGTHRLLREGAKLVEGLQDIMEEIGPQLAARTRPPSARAARPSAEPQLPDEEATVYRLLSHEPRHMDELTALTGQIPSRLSGVLLQLELRGVVRQLAGQRYIRAADEI